MGDGALLEALVRNLVDNALRHGGPHGAGAGRAHAIGSRDPAHRPGHGTGRDAGDARTAWPTLLPRGRSDCHGQRAGAVDRQADRGAARRLRELPQCRCGRRAAGRGYDSNPGPGAFGASPNESVPRRRRKPRAAAASAAATPSRLRSVFFAPACSSRSTTSPAPAWLARISAVSPNVFCDIEPDPQRDQPAHDHGVVAAGGEHQGRVARATARSDVGVGTQQLFEGSIVAARCGARDGASLPSAAAAFTLAPASSSSDNDGGIVTTRGVPQRRVAGGVSHVTPCARSQQQADDHGRITSQRREDQRRLIALAGVDLRSVRQQHLHDVCITTTNGDRQRRGVAGAMLVRDWRRARAASARFPCGPG